jgi:hypothetical protein
MATTALHTGQVAWAGSGGGPPSAEKSHWWPWGQVKRLGMATPLRPKRRCFDYNRRRTATRPAPTTQAGVPWRRALAQQHCPVVNGCMVARRQVVPPIKGRLPTPSAKSVKSAKCPAAPRYLGQGSVPPPFGKIGEIGEMPRCVLSQGGAPCPWTKSTKSTKCSGASPDGAVRPFRKPDWGTLPTPPTGARRSHALSPQADQSHAVLVAFSLTYRSPLPIGWASTGPLCLKRPPSRQCWFSGGFQS